MTTEAQLREEDIAESLGDALYQAALQYVARGWRVLPVDERKRPIDGNGIDHATTDPRQVGEWVARYRPAGFAVVVPEDILVVDVDPRNGGDRSVMELSTTRGYRFPRTLTARTPGGGTHRWYRRQPGQDLSQLRGRLAQGIDLKRDGRGYVVMPPSLDGTYRWVARHESGEDDDPIAPLPDWIEREAQRPRAVAEVLEETVADSDTAYGRAALERELGRLAVAPEGERNDQLNRAAYALGQLVAGGELAEAEVEASLLVAAERVGLDDDETRATIRSGLEAGAREPRTAPIRDPLLDEVDDAPSEGWLDWTHDIPPPEWYARPLIPKNAYVLAYGPTGASKTIVLQWLCARLAERGVCTTYYSLENPPAVDADRLRRLNAPRDRFRVWNRAIELSDPAQLRALIDREREPDERWPDWSPGIIVLDTYSHAFDAHQASWGNENERAIMFARLVRKVMRATGASVIVVDHTGFEVGNDPRGASAKRQQCDVAILFTSQGAWVPGGDAGFKLQNKKPARFANPFEIVGSVVDRGTDLDVRIDPASGWTAERVLSGV